MTSPIYHSFPDTKSPQSSGLPSRTNSSSSKSSAPPYDPLQVNTASCYGTVRTSSSPTEVRNPHERRLHSSPNHGAPCGCIRKTLCFLDKIRRQMSNIGKNAHFMELQIDENRHLLGKGLPLEANDEEGFKAIKRSFRETIMYIFRSQAIYVLLPSVPAALICGKLGLGPSVVFWTNCFAIIPLAALLCFATEELALHTGETIGGLLNATFGNAVEIIVSVFALMEGQIRIVQASMLGSILSNLLLVLGCCFVWGGRNRLEQEFNGTIAGVMSSLMAVASASLILPAVFRMTLENSKKSSAPLVLDLSRYSSIILLFLYCLYLYFNLVSHHSMFNKKESDEEQAESPNGDEEDDDEIETVWVTREQARQLEDKNIRKGDKKSVPADEDTAANGSSSTENSPLLRTGNGSRNSYTSTNGHSNETVNADGKVKIKIPKRHLSWVQATILLAATTAVVSLCADYLVDAIEPLVNDVDWLSKTFIGLIILPIVGNAAEHFTAVVAAGKNKMDLAISVAVGSSLQIAIGVTPLLVLIGWAISQPMTLYFEPFETVVLFVSVLIANYLIQDGKSNYLEGAMLLGVYAIICICFFLMPDDAGKSIDVVFSAIWKGGN